MFENKIVQNNQYNPIYAKYSIYYQLKSALITLPNSTLIVINPVLKTIKENVNSLTRLIVAIPFISILELIKNRFFTNLNYWRFSISNINHYIEYILCQNAHISINSKTGTNNSFRNSDEESKPYKMVQILQNDMMEDTAESDANLIENPEIHTKTKRSIFATLIKRKHARRPKVKITKKIKTCSTVNVETDDVSSEQEVAHYQLSAEYYQPQTSSAESVQPSKSKPYSFLQKIMMCGDYKEEEERDNHSQQILNQLTHFVPTSYMPKYDVKLINGIHELQDILQNLYQSEEHMIYLLKRYIDDTNFQNQLMKASAEFFGLQYDCKCQTNLLADLMWIEQLEEIKIQENKSQETITFLVKTNRSLQLKIENLNRYCEKLADRNNLYPKRFLHMRSIGKTYARNLIDNNRKLQNKLKALTEVLEDYEEEMQRLQQQKGCLDEEKRNLKARVYKLEGILDRNLSDREMEKASLISRINNQCRLIKDGEQVCKYFIQELIEFELQTRQMGIVLNIPKFSYQDACLPETIYQLRNCTGEILASLVQEYTNAITVAKDVNQLRSNNARLQENLQKSTNELDNLSKKLEKSNSKQFENFESKCFGMHQENYTLKIKLESVMEHNQNLEKELEAQKKLLVESNTTLDEISNQTNEILQVVAQFDEKQFSKESTYQEKLEYFRMQYTQVVNDRKHLTERCNNLEEENQNFLQNQQMYQHDLGILQEAVNIMNSENEFLKKQAAAEHQTVISLQNERIKYLEEKNILKTIFQHLKAEVSRIQQLESAVADMSKETNRLALIAEFNKQLGEHLKSEVQVKDHTILELKQSLEQLSHLQFDNDKEKQTLCAQLSEISNVKDKLTDCLETELKKNMHLDESKKKLESTTKNRLKVYEEMQKNERSALKELLKDFKGLIKQRDSLIQFQDDSKKKHQKLEQHSSELKRKYENALLQINERDADMAQLREKLEKKEKQCKELEENSNASCSKYEKTLKKFEKLIGQLRNEKSELETSNTYLKTNMQKMQNDLNEARQKEKDALNQLTVKSAESTTLQAEITSYKNDLQEVNQENGKMKIEVQYLNKMYEQQAAELTNIMSKFSSKDSVFLESQTSLTTKDQQIAELNKLVLELETKIKRLEHEDSLLKKQNEDQNKIMCAYENQLVVLQDVEATKLKLEKELHNVHLEQKSTQNDLENAKKEVEKLNNELKTQMEKLENEKLFYKSRANELIIEYNEQKEDIEVEIDNISNQLRKVNESLYSEKQRFDELSKNHEDLKEKFTHIKQALGEEVKAHQETCRKLEETDNILKSLGNEKEQLEQQIQALTTELNQEKDKCILLSTDNKKLQVIFEQGRQQYGALMTANANLEREMRELQFEIQHLVQSKVVSEHEISNTFNKMEEKKSELQKAQHTIECLKMELADSQKKLFDMREEFFKMQQQVTGLEFKNCELTLQIHEAQTKLETERNLYKELKCLKPEDETTQAPSSCGELFY